MLVCNSLSYQGNVRDLASLKKELAALGHMHDASTVDSALALLSQHLARR